MKCNEYYPEKLWIWWLSQCLPPLTENLSKMFADVYLSFYILSDVVVCLTRWWKCRVPNKEAMEFWVPFVFTENSEVAYTFIKLTKPILSTIFFPYSIKYLLMSKFSGLICVLNWLECKFIRGKNLEFKNINEKLWFIYKKSWWTSIVTVYVKPLWRITLLCL